jgi:hypothetical protein
MNTKKSRRDEMIVNNNEKRKQKNPEGMEGL